MIFPQLAYPLMYWKDMNYIKRVKKAKKRYRAGVILTNERG
jgi:hypothetical protein